jgi:hypothetical protein
MSVGICSTPRWSHGCCCCCCYFLLQVMWWMEQCAYISASRLRGHHLLTAGMDSVAFARPTHVGDIMYITAQVCGRGWKCVSTAGPGCQSVHNLTDTGHTSAFWCPLHTHTHLLLHPPPSSCWLCCKQVTAIFGSSLEVMISVCAETPSQVRQAVLQPIT